jgi:hypothetical protein
MFHSQISVILIKNFIINENRWHHLKFFDQFKKVIFEIADSSSSGGEGLASILGTSANTVLSRASIDVSTRLDQYFGK